MHSFLREEVFRSVFIRGHSNGARNGESDVDVKTNASELSFFIILQSEAVKCD